MSSLAFVFPGQGSQAVGMGRALAALSPAAATAFAEADQALGEPLSVPVSGKLLGRVLDSMGRPIDRGGDVERSVIFPSKEL